MAPTVIIVEGQSNLQRAPERCVLDIEIMDEGYVQQDVSNHVVTTAHHLQTEIEKFSQRLADGTVAPDAPVAFYSIASLSTSSHAEHNDEGQKTGKKVHHARTSLDVRFRDFRKPGEVAVMLASIPFVNLKSVDWRLTDESLKAVKDEAKMEALRDALRKAEAYADVIGRKNLTTVKIADTMGDISLSRTMQTARMAIYASNKSSSLGLDFEPKMVITSARMEVEFAAE